MGALWKFRREALAAAAIFWLAGFFFFYDGFYHMTVFRFLLVPLVLANLDLAWDGRGRAWKALLALLLLWQFGCGLRAGGWWSGLGDLAGVVTLAVATLAVLEVRWGWRSLRLGLLAAAVMTSAWALVRFYPMSGLGLSDERLRNVLVYPIGLNAVLTGLLIGFGVVAGLGAAPRRWRWVARAAFVVLGFALLATQSRGAWLATVAGVGVLVWSGWRRILPDLASLSVGAVAYGVSLTLTAGEPDGRGLVERGSSGRFDIWSTYLGELRGAEWLVGQGRVEPLGEEVLGWLVHHPHGSWVAQVVWCGLPGLALLAGFIAVAGLAGWRIRAREAAPLALLAFGIAGLMFDGSQAISLASVPRIEPLLLLVPALLALRFAGPPEKSLAS